MEEIVTFYRHNLNNTAAGKSALEYLHERGLNDATIEAFFLWICSEILGCHKQLF